MSRLDKIKVACSGLSNRIQLYRMGSDPLVAIETKDVTTEALAASVEHLMNRPDMVWAMIANHAGKKKRFTLTLEVSDEPEAPDAPDALLH